jgi:N-acetylglutamate synthase-like GNAT family acetyltransferase
MFVQREFRGPEHATAKRLLDVLLAWADEKQVHEIFLGTTAKFLAAHRFYAKHGFREIARSALPPAFPIMAVDTLFFRRTEIRVDPPERE